MATETGRHRLHEKIKESWGEDNAAEPMSYFPPVGWADVATKHDLQLLSAELRGEMANLEARIERSLASQLRWMISTMIAMTAIFSVIVSVAN